MIGDVETDARFGDLQIGYGRGHVDVDVNMCRVRVSIAIGERINEVFCLGPAACSCLWRRIRPVTGLVAVGRGEIEGERASKGCRHHDPAAVVLISCGGYAAFGYVSGVVGRIGHAVYHDRFDESAIRAETESGAPIEQSIVRDRRWNGALQSSIKASCATKHNWRKGGVVGCLPGDRRKIGVIDRRADTDRV